MTIGIIGAPTLVLSSLLGSDRGCKFTPASYQALAAGDGYADDDSTID